MKQKIKILEGNKRVLKWCTEEELRWQSTITSLLPVK
jgi:hypothetical protein